MKTAKEILDENCKASMYGWLTEDSVLKAMGIYKNLAQEQAAKGIVKWQSRDEMDAPTNPLQALYESFTRTSKDMGENKFDAWNYGVIIGWDDAYKELAIKHNWSKEQVEYNKLLHENFNKAWNLFMDYISNNADKKAQMSEPNVEK